MISHIFTWGSLGFYFCILFFLYSDGLCLMFPDVFQFLGKAMLTHPVCGKEVGGRVGKCEPSIFV